MTRHQPLLTAGAPQLPSTSRTVPLRDSTSVPVRPVQRLASRAATAGTTTRPASPAGIPVQRLMAVPRPTAADASRPMTLPAPTTPFGSGAPALPAARPAQGPGPGAYPPVVPGSAVPGSAVPQHVVPQNAVPQDIAPVQRSTDGARFSGVAEAFTVARPVPAFGGSAAPGAPHAYQRDLPVPLVAAAPAPPMVLPVQRTPATPSVANPATGLSAPARRAEPWATPVVVQRTGGGNGGGSGGGNGGGSGGGSRHEPPSPYSATAGHASVPRDADSATSGFDPRKLKDEQVDELTHKLIGPLTRMLRTELRLDRERIGRLRDPRR
jgi:hypothetical protein